MLKNVFVLSFLLCMTCSLWPSGDVHAQACDYIKLARLGGGNLNIRPSSNTNQSPVGTVPDGTCLKVLDKTTSGQDVKGNTTWYKITYNNNTGWISGYYADCSTCGGSTSDCTDGQTRTCYSGPDATKDKGACKVVHSHVVVANGEHAQVKSSPQQSHAMALMTTVTAM